MMASSRESSLVNLRKNISGTDSVRSATIRRSGAPVRSGVPFREPSETGIPVLTPTPPPIISNKHKKVEKKPSIPLGNK